MAAFGIVITNSNVQVCNSRSCLFHCSSLIVVEARAILEAVSYASSSPHSCGISMIARPMCLAFQAPSIYSLGIVMGT
ncbi:hypothetical protein LINPERHAP2_LOCUS30106 [Linum perenne]